MFVDNVIIFGSENITEWDSYKEVLELFCKVIGMAFIPQKHLFLESGWVAEELALLKEIFPFEVKPVDVVFKYLKFFF